MGCVGYWLLTGQPVFAAETPVSTLLKHVQEEPIPPSRRTEMEIAADLDAVILACLAKDPADRPQTTEELDARLATCSVDAWTKDRAEEWWKLHARPYRGSTGESPST